ncbi:unnamed protein product [Mytilus coruscus]|uniref:Ig-like domain-containing protein n=1 Tax=Mytilus coruscus TaxID=42192 RepID=A0A6J8APL9_MYTCO|nr:unnamed protein product [Mytilus coruscus]
MHVIHTCKYYFLPLRNLLDTEEVEKVIEEFEDPCTAQILNKNKVQVSDCQGREAKLTIWGHPGSDISGMVSRSEKVAGTCEKLLQDEVYHYHGKLVTKEPFTGGAHLWHQDYGYWYINEFLEPNMMTVFIALDKCEKTNGCLQIVESSHKCGRLDHKLEGQLTITDPSRLDKIMERFPMKYCLLNPGRIVILAPKIHLISEKTLIDGTPDLEIAKGIPKPVVTWEEIDPSCTKTKRPFVAPLISIPSTVIVKYYTNATQLCNVIGYPKPSVTWEYKKNRHIPGDKIAAGRMFIPNVTKEDTGLYTCIATSSVGFSRANVMLETTYELVNMQVSGIVTCTATNELGLDTATATVIVHHSESSYNERFLSITLVNVGYALKNT